MNPHRIAGVTLGVAVFVLGIGLLIYTFFTAFSALSHPITFNQPTEITNYLVNLLKNIAYLFIMGLCATLIAIMGVKMFQGSG